MKRLVFVIFIFGFLSPMGFAQNLDKAKLDTYFKTLETHNKFMGSVAISENGKLIYKKSIGFSDYENKIKANENAKYRIGSISKTFTSVLVLKAIEDNRLDYNQTIDKFFPSIKNAEKITIKHLLRHRSGIHSFTDNEDYLTWNTESKTEKEMLNIINKGGIDFEADSKAEYSNSNFVLLTYILEKIYHKTFAVLITKYITEPLGLRHTYLGGKINIQNNESKSYRFLETWKPEPETDISIPLGAGGVVSTPSDLVKFSNALFGGKLLNKESVESMKTIKDHFGIGLFQVPFYNRMGYGHTGGIDGFSSVFSYFSDGNISYAMCSNGKNCNTNNISVTVLSAIYNRPYDIPEFKTYQLKTEDLDKYLGVYSSTQIPLKITISKENKTLISQATGQASFPLEAIEKDKFKFDQAGIVLEFDPREKKMILKQGGGQFIFIKE